MIPIFEPYFVGNERAYLMNCIHTGWISSQGSYIQEFENAFARRSGVSFGVATSNCTTALHLALEVLGIGADDEVICPDLTFIAPANMIRLTNAKLVLVDVEPISWAIDPRKMEEKITPKTKAVIVVHPFGHMADMDPIMNLAKKHGIKVIEDVAEAPDALYKGQRAGSFGDMACYSFFANKIITTGEGGIVLTQDPELDKLLRIYRDHGMSREKRYVHVVPGFNYRMTNMQAAIGVAQLEKIDEIHHKRFVQREYYQKIFAGNSKVSWRPLANWCTPVHWLSTITLRDATLRDPLLAYLKEKGIDCRQMIYPVHDAAHFKDLDDPADFAVTKAISYASLHLPSSTPLSFEQMDLIANLVQEWLEKNDR